MQTQIVDNQILISDLSLPDDECKLFFGAQSTFCRTNNSSSICSQIFCRTEDIITKCLPLPLNQTRNGVICGSGKICFQSKCVPSRIAPIEQQQDCSIFGDDLVRQDMIGIKLPFIQMSCQSVLDYVKSIKQSPNSYCREASFQKACCQTCKKYNAMYCADSYFDCPIYKDYCFTGATLNEVPVNQVCKRTCQYYCKASPLKCVEAAFLCQNGATCVNKNSTSLSSPNGDYFGFECKCASGYFGELCEKKNSCEPNPCLNGGACQNNNIFNKQYGFKCECKQNYTGFDCSIFFSNITNHNDNSNNNNNNETYCLNICLSYLDLGIKCEENDSLEDCCRYCQTNNTNLLFLNSISRLIALILDFLFNLLKTTFFPSS